MMGEVKSPSFWVPVSENDKVNTATYGADLSSPRRKQTYRMQLREMETSPIQSRLALSAASERRAAFLEKRRERLATGLARVDATRSLREEQLERLRAKGRDVQLRLEMAHAERQQRLQSTTEKCSEQVAHAKAVAARLRERQNELKDRLMRRSLERLQGGTARRMQHLRRRSELTPNSLEKSPSKKDEVTSAAIRIQRWWREVSFHSTAATFQAGAHRTLIRVLRGQPVEKLTFHLAQKLVSLPEVTKATQSLLCQLTKACQDIGVTSATNSRDARLLLSCVVTSLFPDLVLEQQGPMEKELVDSAKKMLISFGSVVGLCNTPKWSRMMKFTATWLRFKSAFSAWKQHDSVRLVASFREHWLQLVALKQTVMSNEGANHDEAQSQWLPNIERQQQDILKRVRQVAGQAGLNDFLASVPILQPAPSRSQPTDAGRQQPIRQQPTGTGGEHGQAASGSSDLASSSSGPSSGDSGSPSSSGGADQGQTSSDGAEAGSGGGGNDNNPPRSPSAPDAADTSVLDVLAVAKNLELAHEIVMDENFALKKVEAQAGSLMESVQQNMMAAFWAVLQEELDQTPPAFDQVLRLLAEVKENLKSTLPGQSVSSLHREIDAGLDIDLIKQQLEQGVLNIKSLALFVTSVMARSCAPVRDEQIHDLQASLGSDTLSVPAMFQAILDLIAEMRLDLANHELRSIRPVLLQHAAQYERTKFQELFPGAPESGVGHTFTWLAKAQQNCAVSASAEQITPLDVLHQAFVDLATQPGKHMPETWWLDNERLSQIATQLEWCGLLQSMAMLAGGVLGHRLANNGEFMSSLHRNLYAILSDSAARSQTIQDVEENLILATSSAADFFRQAQGMADLDESEKVKLHATVRLAFSKESPVRNVLSRRIASCVHKVVSRSPSDLSIEIPPGLQLVEKNLRTTLTSFARLATYNKKVFGPMYSSLLQKLFQS